MQIVSIDENKQSPNKQFLYLDVRTKLLATLVIAQVMICSDNSEAYNRLKILAAILPFAIAFLSGYYKSAVRYAILYFIIYMIAVQVKFESAVGSMIVVLITGFLYQFMPGMYLLTYLMKSTPVREFIAAMKKMHAPDAITIPISIMFRFIPAIHEEYQSISQAMSMRDIASVRNPITMFEYRIVPLLMSILNIGNELSVAAIARGLGNSGKRTTVYKIKLGIQDMVMMLFLVGIFITSIVLIII